MDSITRHTASQPQHFIAPDGLSLAVERCGAAAAPVLLFAHGFGQTRQAWRGATHKLAAAGWQCVSFDARGHGDSERVADGRYHLAQFIEDLRALASAQPSPPVLIGASMGGLLGIAVAGDAQRPAPFSALALVDITPRWEAAGVARILDFMRAYPQGFADHDAAAVAVATYLPQRSGRKGGERLRALLRRGADGRLRWHWDPALLDVVENEGRAHQQALLEATRRIRLPTLLVSGGLSDVVSATTVDEFMQLLPGAVHVNVPGATHMLAGDANDAFVTAIADFVRALPRTPAGVES
jgi:pimeloyl-ACP methyl ester carboxylesterase